MDPWMHLANVLLARAGSSNYPQNAVLWFLPCLFATEMLFLGTFTLVKSKRDPAWLGCCRDACHGQLSLNHGHAFLWSADWLAPLSLGSWYLALLYAVLLHWLLVESFSHAMHAEIQGRRHRCMLSMLSSVWQDLACCGYSMSWPD